MSGPNARRRWVCRDCGLRLEGVERNGVVYAGDRSATDQSIPPATCLCTSCVEGRQ